MGDADADAERAAKLVAFRRRIIDELAQWGDPMSPDRLAKFDTLALLERYERVKTDVGSWRAEPAILRREPIATRRNH
jgi:hypothetical protein